MDRMLISVKDIYGKSHNFDPSFINVISEVDVKITNDLNQDTKMTCFVMSFLSGDKVYISSDIKDQLFPPYQPQQEQPVVEETEVLDVEGDSAQEGK